MFLEILQNSQENTCTRVSFLIKQRLWHRCFPVILKAPFLTEHLCWLLLYILQSIKIFVFLSLTHIMPLVPFYTSWTYQNSYVFGGYRNGPLHEMGLIRCIVNDLPNRRYLTWITVIVIISKARTIRFFLFLIFKLSFSNTCYTGKFCNKCRIL